MKSNRKAIGNWSESYLNTLELLYGSFDLHPNLTVAELCEDWQECFQVEGQVQMGTEWSDGAVREWSDAYLDTLEILYGEFNLHPVRNIEELAKEWAENFREDGKVQSAIDRRQAIPEWNNYDMTA